MAEVRHARPEDITKISEIEQANAQNPWTYSQFETELNIEYAHLLCAEIDGAIVGVCDIHVVADDAHINELCVAQEHRRAGAATALVTKACEIAKENGSAAISLEVRSTNRPARSFYGSLGFKEIGRRWGFYQNPSDDALTMEKKI